MGDEGTVKDEEEEEEGMREMMMEVQGEEKKGEEGERVDRMNRGGEKVSKG